MDFELNEEQRILKDTVRSFAEKEIRPQVEQYYREERYPRELITKMAELGLLGGVLPEQYGGAGMDYISYTVCIEELARVCQTSASAMTKASGLVGSGILHYGTEEQKQNYLVPLARGEKLGGAGVTEPHSGTDVPAMETTAVKDGDYYVINGEKTWISGLNSEWFLSFATLDKTKKYESVIAFIVERGAPGFSTNEIKDKLGFRPSAIGSLIFEDCRIPRENLVGQEGEGFKVLSCATGNGRLGNAARAVGVAQACLEESVKFARERIVFGKPIARLQMIQSKIADMVVGVETARLLTYKCAADMQARGGIMRATRLASMAKLYASDMLMKTATEAMQIHGANGCSYEYPVNRYFRDAKFFQIAEGVNELHRSQISDYVTGYKEDR